MILAVDARSLGTLHVPFNSAMLETLAHALPMHTLRVYTTASHDAELRRDLALASNPRLEFDTLTPSSHWRDKIDVVSLRRLADELVTLMAALRTVPRREYCLLVLLVTTATTMLAARLLLALRPRSGLVICLHGNVHTISASWRTRNPLLRRLDTKALLERRAARPLLHLVFEECVRRELGRLVPATFATTETLPHPVSQAEAALAHPTPLQYPVRIGLVGRATPGKGTGPYLALARAMKARYGDKVEFYLLGRATPDADLNDLTCLAMPPSSEPLSRDRFCALLAPLHYVCLPLQPDYYRYAASGAVVDALTWLKPLIATDLPLTADLFARHGDLGYLCADDAAAMEQALHRVLSTPDPARYAAQVAAVHSAREARLPVTLAPALRDHLHRHLPDLIG